MSGHYVTICFEFITYNISNAYKAQVSVHKSRAETLDSIAIAAAVAMTLVLHGVCWLLLLTAVTDAATIPTINTSSTDETVTAPKGCFHATETRMDSEYYS